MREQCPTGIATQDEALQNALVVPYKAQRVATYHQKTVHTALELVKQTWRKGC